MLWYSRSPEDSSIKQKMVYSASKEKFQFELGSGLARVIQANDDGDLEWANVFEQITRNDWRWFTLKIDNYWHQQIQSNLKISDSMQNYFLNFKKILAVLKILT